ncbi:HK97 family phage prohead protease [Streptomyces sp. NPDC046915]|uniref:HK97 family phage prohead protease n=1 Tax=Streptomyces sp. NPDC046915 TaxID=3155257 RepID=UPI0033E68676
MVDRHQLRDAPERRAIASGQFEVRAVGGDLELTGYASVFNNAYDVLGGPPYGWREIVDPRAFDVTLAAKPDLHLLINHEGMPLARTKSGTLKLATDSTGLHVEAALDPSDPDVQRLMPKMKRKDMDEMSFAFRVKADKWSDDDSERTLTEVSLHKGDVSVVNFGANPNTSAQLNSMQQALDLLVNVDPEQAMAELRSGDTNAIDRLAAARENLAALQRGLTPQSKRTSMSLAEALAVQGDETRSVTLSATIPAHSTPVTDAPMDRRAALNAAPGDQVVLRYMHAWVDPAGKPDDKGAYWGAHHEGRVGAPAHIAAVRYHLSMLPHSPIPEDQRAAVERHLRRHLDEAE